MFCKALGKKSLIAIVVSIATSTVMLWEGYENTAYQDVVGVWTICSGETQNVHKGMYLSDRECEEMTSERVEEFARGVDDLVHVDVSPRYHAAITSWAYNVGLNAMAQSTLLRKLNAKNYKGACKELLRWNRAGGRVIQGLVNRRQYEFEMCMEGVNEG